jgi:hypothetical protein
MSFIALALLAAAPAELDLPRFEAIEVAGGGHVVLRHGPVQRVRLLEGDTSISRVEVERQHHGEPRLLVRACKQRCPRRYKLVVAVTSPRVSAVAVRGGGLIEAVGGTPPARAMAAAVTGGGSIDLRGVEAREMAASVRGGGQILTRVRGSLAASVAGGGVIRYWGNPTVAQSVRGGGAVLPGR